MAVGEARQQAKSGNRITQVSWTDWIAQDVYYWLDHSFQYSSNVNCDDELHWIKLSSRAVFTDKYAKCQLTSLGNYWVMALPINTTSSSDPTIYLWKRFYFKSYFKENTQTHDILVDDEDWFSEIDSEALDTHYYLYNAVPWTVFQDKFWFGFNQNDTSITPHVVKWHICKVNVTWTNINHWKNSQKDYVPQDHKDYSDESIMDPNDIKPESYMKWNITAILNYNNTRLVVAAWQDIWVYYPELDFLNPECPNYDPSYTPVASDYWKTGWKKVLHYEAWVTVVALTCTFEYLKVRAVDEWWNTKVYFYQGNNNLRSTFVYNLIDLTGVRVLHVYSINWIDYYVSSIGNLASDALVDFNKMVWTTPIKLFTQRAGLCVEDINTKAPYFVWPVGIDWAYYNGYFYVADSFWAFRFKYTPNWFDKGYMKWKLNSEPVHPYWVCVNKWILYVSTDDWCRAMRLYDTWFDGYQNEWVLISREFEWKEWWTITKMLDEIRMNYELNPHTELNWQIDVYVSPNNTWKSTSEFTESNWWYWVMHIDQDSWKTRTEKSNLINNLGNDGSSFKFDWQTITYAIKFTRFEAVYTSGEHAWETKDDEDKTQDELKAERATPIVRQLDIKYHCKDKVNNVYDIN